MAGEHLLIASVHLFFLPLRYDPAPFDFAQGEELLSLASTGRCRAQSTLILSEGEGCSLELQPLLA
jgi:hypothetical protein